MKISNTLGWLVALVVILSVIASGVGLLYQNDGAPFTFVNVRGETVPMYGQGLYRYEILRDGVGFKGSDLYVLFVGVPLLIVSTVLYRRGSLRGGLVLTGTLAYFLYNAASMTFGYAYNNLFLVYTALLTTTLFATVLAFLSFDLATLPHHFSEHLPRRSIAAFLFFVGVSLLLVWGVMDILPALLTGTAPPLNNDTTLPTHALDMGIIAPLAFVASVLLLRRNAFGYLLASVLLIVSAVLGGGVLALSAAQVLSGTLTFAQVMMFVIPFVLLTAFALGLTILLLRSVSEHQSAEAGAMRMRVAQI
jgi:hypothetical protein